jgi:hypothetical protein
LGRKTFNIDPREPPCTLRKTATMSIFTLLTKTVGFKKDHLLGGIPMRHVLRSIAVSVAIAPALFVNTAHATSWFDYSSTPAVQITSTDFHAATLLRKVTVVCPKAGFIVANATSQFAIFPSAGGWAYVGAGFSLAINDPAPTEMDSNSAHYISAYSDGITESGATQRVASCTAGQTMNVFFMGYLQTAETASSAYNPTLVVQFFDTRI